MSSVVRTQFQVMGNKSSEWQGKLGESFMDKSLQINADTIMENVKLVMNQIKENPPLQELNKKLIMALVAFQTAQVAQPAFADDVVATAATAGLTKAQALE